MEVVINSEQFYSRLNKIHSHWLTNKNLYYENCNVLCVPMGAVKSAEVIYSKSSALHLYLLGYEFPESLIILTNNKFYFVTTQKKAAYVEAIKDDTKFPIETFYKTKDENANKELFKTILSTIKKNSGTVIGTIVKGEFEGKFIPLWNETLAAESFTTVDISRGLGICLSLKDATELDICKRASVLTNKVLKHGFVNEMEEIIDKDRSETHLSLAQKIESIIYDPSKLGINVSKEVVESCYSPIIQSGGDYDIRVSAQTNDKVMQFDVIICSLGARYRNYCANIARTYLIDPVKKILDTYTTLMTLVDKCLEQMIVGSELKDVMEGAKTYLNKKGPELIEYLPKTLGFAIGLEFRDSTMLLNSTNTTRFEVGMVFNLIVGFQNIPLSDEDKRGASSSIKKLNHFSLLIADTVVIQPEGVPDVLTKSTRTTSDITYNLADNDEDGGGDGNGDGNGRELKNEPTFEDGLRRSTRGKEEKEAAERAAVHRVQRQRELMEAKIALARRKGRGGGGDADDGPTTSGTDLNTYSSTEDFPKDTNPYRLKVDMQREAVLVPINGQIVPFHISTIKNVSMPEPDRATYLRINFYSTGMSLGKDAPKNIQHLIAKYGASAFVKELTFRSLDPKNLTAVYRNILELRKRLRQSEQKKEEERDLVEQDKLIRIKDQRVPQLQDLTMRPQLSGRKSTGSLAAHQNGLRFTTTKGEIIDVLYSNIKHGFFQPCESATMVLIHFHLKDYILIGKKKQKDIQFYTEVIDASLNLDNQRRSAYDPDELDDEQREREMKRRLNKTFLEFCKKVEKVAKHYEFNLNYDIPYNDLGFYGTCNREMVYIMPTVSCLVNLTEMPFFVVDISEVDHVHFERVTFSTKNFDMVIIFKTFETRAISAIEIKYLEQIQDWLSDVQVTYTSGPDSFQWKAVMDTAKEDDRFYYDTHADGTPKAVGWLMLVEGTQEEDSEDQSEEDSEYGGGGENSEEEEDEESDDSEDSEDSDESFADEDEDSDGEEEDEDDLEEKGKSWEELEEDARASDRNKRMHDEDEEDHAPKKKLKGKR